MHINIKDKLIEKKMSRYELSQIIDVTYPTMTSIYNGLSTSIKLDISEKICIALNCKPNDILVFDNTENSTSSNIDDFKFMNPHNHKSDTTL